MLIVATLLLWIPRLAAVCMAALLSAPTGGRSADASPSPPPVLTVEPSSIRLSGPRSSARLLVTIKRGDGTTTDVSDRAKLSHAGQGAIRLDGERRLRPVRDGSV